MRRTCPVVRSQPSGVRSRASEVAPDDCAIRIGRRKLVTIALLAGVAPVGRGMAQGTTAMPAASPTGDWRYTDWFGQEIVLPAGPTRIATTLNVAAALWDTGLRPVAVFDYVALPIRTATPRCGATSTPHR